MLLLVLVVLAAACGPEGVARPSAQSPTGSQPSAPKRVVAAIMGDGNTLYPTVNPGVGGVPGLDAVGELANAGLSVVNSEGRLVPQLAEEVPTAENGLWKVFPDGRMETSWRVRENARWHDGTSFTTDDLLFSATLMQDQEVPNFTHPFFRSLESLEATDSRTITARWKTTFINADALFSRDAGYPFPKHILERTYLEDKAQLLTLPHWSEQFVGTGSFKLRQFVRGSHLVMEANPDYVLGRPKIDVLEVRFIPDSAALATNILAGEVDLTIGRTFSVEQAVQLRDQWRDGKMLVAPYALTRIYPQFINPDPAVILNVQFRRALVHAIDRQTMVDTLESGLTEVSQSVLPPGRPEFREIEAGIARYDYDTRKATEMVEGLGYSRGPDGILRDAAGGRLGVELRATGGQDILEKPVLLVAEAWRGIGVATDPLFVPPQRNQDREYRANRPGFLLAGGLSDLQILGLLLAAEVPLAETNYVGRNDARYNNPEYEALYGRFLVTIPQAERQELLRRIVHHIADNQPIIGLYYRVDPTMVANRVTNVYPRLRTSLQPWNAHEWDVR